MSYVASEEGSNEGLNNYYVCIPLTNLIILPKSLTMFDFFMIVLYED